MARLSYRNRGYVRFSEIYGRQQDFIFTKTKGKVYLTALVFGAHIKAFANIKAWQITQHLPGALTLKIVKASSYNTSDEVEITQAFNRVSDFLVKFEYVDVLEKTRSGKHV